jgi:hypothetical protein
LASRRRSPSSASPISAGEIRNGNFLVLRHTVRDRLREKLRQVKQTRMADGALADRGSRAVPGKSADRLLQLLRRSHQQPGDQLVLSPCRVVLVSGAAAAEPKQLADMATHETWIDLFLPPARIPIPKSGLTLRPEAGARCGSSARRDLSGGRRAIAVPTASAPDMGIDLEVRVLS